MSPDLTLPVTGAAAAPADARARRSPMLWVPTLYFAEGLPFYTVMAIAGMMYKGLGVANDQIGYWTALLGLAWAFKPLWSPFLEGVPSKRWLVIGLQTVAAGGMAGVAFALHLPAWFGVSLALLALLALNAATHDIAADGLYIANLSARQQAAYAGWQGAFFNAAKAASLGGLLMLVGHFEKSMSPQAAWTLVFAAMGVMMAAIAAWHVITLPEPPAASATGAPRQSLAQIGALLWDVLKDFFTKPGIWFAVLFIVLFRAGEGQIQTIGPLFLKDARSAGGLGLSTDQIGQAYGVVGTLAFLAGSVLGGYFTAWLGLRRAMFVLILAVNLPNLVFWWLGTALPTDLALISAALGVEMFGYGFGFVGVILFIMQVVAKGRYTTAHYALGTGVMQLGFMLFKSISGAIQVRIGYQHFFLWVLACALPVLLLSFFLPKAVDGAAGGDAAEAA